MAFAVGQIGLTRSFVPSPLGDATCSYLDWCPVTPLLISGSMFPADRPASWALDLTDVY